MRSVMVNQFQQVANAQIQRSSFDRSHGYKTTFNAGFLIPIFIDEVLPGDTFNLKMTGFARLATPIYPIMDNMFMETFFFFIPNRLVWENWERFNGAQDNPGDSTDFTIPIMTTDTWVEGSMADYFGLPVGVPLAGVSALPFRCYNLTYNQWFRDENLQNSRVVNLTDANSVMADHSLMRRGKRRDYFTSCLPFPQKGPGVDIPLGTQAPVGVFSGGSTEFTIQTFDFSNNEIDINTAGATAVFGTDEPGGSPLVVDLSQATGATINSWRQAFQIQRMFERDARGGTRYVEILRSHWGVTSPDFRLQRVEYLGGGSSPVTISEVQNNISAASPIDRPLGSLAATGRASLHGHGFIKSFVEHGYILGLVCVRADLTYQQGLEKMWSRQTRFDFAWPSFAHLGEQAVLSKEIYYDGTAGDEDVFGYQERYAEYRHKPSRITGAFRSSAATPLDAWHLSQEFATRPVLDNSFINEDPPLDRVIAVTSEPHFLFDSFFNLRCARPLPMFGTPGLIDHF